MLRDPHDPRQFRRYVKFAADGSVASVHDLEAGAVPQANMVEVTDLSPIDFAGISIDPALVAVVSQTSQDVATKTEAIAVAEADLSLALTTRDTAIGNARAALSVAAGKPKA